MVGKYLCQALNAKDCVPLKITNLPFSREYKIFLFRHSAVIGTKNHQKTKVIRSHAKF